MKVDREEIKKHVIEALVDVLNDESVPVIDEKTNPIITLGLDSFSGVDYACSLSTRLKFHIPNHINPLVDDDLNIARDVEGIINLVCELMLPEGERLNGRR
ncbi:MAG: hypothetical protein ABSA86_08760 [Oryzomonas sp.]